MVQNLSEKKGIQLLIGILGIYICYWTAGYLQQKILKTPYVKYNEEQTIVYFDSPISLIWMQSIVAWILGYLINRNLQKPHITIPKKKFIVCAILITVSTFSGILAIKLTSYPIVMMIKSCSIIPVVFVGIFCSRVKDHSLRLGVQKIIVALFISLGILIYNIGGDQVHKDNATNIIGILMLAVSLLADGFLPDLQAAIKSQFNPAPTQMFEQTNKWITIISLFYAQLTGQISQLVDFCMNSPACLVDILIYVTLSAIGQIFVYRMIKQFKQHIVPFVTTTRKIFTVVISIIFYHHTTTFMQMVGIFIVFASASYEYFSQVFWAKPNLTVSMQKDFDMDQKLQTPSQETQSSSKQKLEPI